MGKIRHMDVRYLWLQEVRKGGGIKIRKIKGEENPADIMTKPMGAEEIARLTRHVGVQLQFRT